SSDLVALPVDEAVHALVAAAAMARCDPPVVVAASGFAQRLGQRALGLGLGDLVEGRHGHAAATRRRWLVRLNWHYTPSKRSRLCPDFSVTMAFFQERVVPTERPRRRILPLTWTMLTAATWIFLLANASSTACLIWILLAVGATSKTYLPCSQIGRASCRE